MEQKDGMIDNRNVADAIAEALREFDGVAAGVYLCHEDQIGIEILYKNNVFTLYLSNSEANLHGPAGHAPVKPLADPQCFQYIMSQMVKQILEPVIPDDSAAGVYMFHSNTRYKDGRRPVSVSTTQYPIMTGSTKRVNHAI